LEGTTARDYSQAECCVVWMRRRRMWSVGGRWDCQQPSALVAVRPRRRAVHRHCPSSSHTPHSSSTMNRIADATACRLRQMGTVRQCNSRDVRQLHRFHLPTLPIRRRRRTNHGSALVADTDTSIRRRPAVYQPLTVCHTPPFVVDDRLCSLYTCCRISHSSRFLFHPTVVSSILVLLTGVSFHRVVA
jgi:hypothetical protein